MTENPITKITGYVWRKERRQLRFLMEQFVDILPNASEMCQTLLTPGSLVHIWKADFGWNSLCVLLARHILPILNVQENSKIRRMQEDWSLLGSRLHWYLDMSPAGRRRSANIVLLCFFNFKCHQQLPTTLEASTLPLRWTKFYLRQRAGTSWIFPSPNFLIFEPQHRFQGMKKRPGNFKW